MRRIIPFFVVVVVVVENEIEWKIDDDSNIKLKSKKKLNKLNWNREINSRKDHKISTSTWMHNYKMKNNETPFKK
jgi:hypothetical protein